MVGAGYVGLITGVGYSVICFDIKRK
ncbi:Protein of unknown function [Bacillus cytotoxicus]|uniref:UDP-glucose/GDP-mannose dehydrogenase N-terminal domain-containing protein n=1 Tax=Bacillus cytotoxicus TaxID=580165 RepID=A0AAX2CN32_9BACI|nr:Protein of unknown function [Bacillus cytotoxicus]